MRPAIAALGATLCITVSAVATAQTWQGSVEVVAGNNTGQTISGYVFEDSNGDSRRQNNEAGVAGVLVSNGLEVVRTDNTGRYRIAVRPDMDLTVVQPAGWQVPVDHRMVPQFGYIHKPGGTPVALRFGGLPDTGPAPAEVNFPLRRAPQTGDGFTCAAIGDSQTYSNGEVSQFRDSAIADLVQMDLDGNDCLLYLGDVVGDDLDVLERLLEVGSVVGVPQWMALGNHDIDFDATSDADSSDSWRRIYGPTYYAYEIGEVTFVVLDNIVYPCGEDDLRMPGREFCVESPRPVYNVRVHDTQLQWLDNLLTHIPEDRLVVMAHHGPMLSFYGSDSYQHQDDATARIHELLEGREALSLSGHLHTLENIAPGESFGGWQQALGVSTAPFRHIVAGAASGHWWQGDLALDGDAMALQRMGAPKGLLMLKFQGAAYEEHYIGSRIDPRRGQWVDFNTPAFRTWFDHLQSWRGQPAQERNPTPPVSINDLADTRILTPQELQQGVYVTANVWNGSVETRVVATINGGEPLTMTRTQQGRGESAYIGAEFADPFTVKRQSTVGRFAIESTMGTDRTQGYEAYRGSRFQGPPQPQTAIADRNMHLWRAQLPADLAPGVHIMEVTSTDRHGRMYKDRVVFEVRSERPDPLHRVEVWDMALPL
tara:strand:+ start:3491 stop:5452 length:1962 start_codon:yes stop_codon:yes gene_type:complete